jgi:alkylation response protein AidB-like acyl-CoA dehydrogenase
MATRDSLALTDDQRDLRDKVRDFLADQLPPAALRGMLDTDPGYSPKLHTRLATELGVAALTVPGEFGGLGRGPAEAGVLHAELGRALYPGPFLASSLAAAVLLTAADRTAAVSRAAANGSSAANSRAAEGGAAEGGAAEGGAAARRWLPRLADGSAIGTVAVADQDGLWSSGPGRVRAHLTSHGWRLYGRCWYVMAAHVADIVVVSALAGSVPAMFLVEAGAPGFRSFAQPGPDLTRRVCVTAFEATPAVLLGQGDAAVAALARVERDFLLATAAEAVGGIDWCADATVVYAKDRELSDRPANFFQAIAHACVEMLATFQTTETAVRYAAVTAAEGAAEAPMAVRVAALQAGQAYRTVTESAIDLLGGIGIAREHYAHLYYRRAWSAERLSGGPRARRAALAHPAGP